jgi:ankyrin repeat protein
MKRTAMQPGIDRVLSGSELDRNVSGTALRSFDLFINSESLDQQGFTLLHLIVLELQFLDLAMVLKHYPIDIDAPDVNGRTALYWAAWRGDILSLSLLLQYGADVDKIDSESWTPLARASKAGHLGVVQYLLSAHASLTISTAQGYLPIHLASDNKPDGAKIVQELLTRGSDPNACSISRGTPLHNAANRGSVATVECLLAHGAVIDALDGDGDTPVLISLLCWNEATFMCLARAGARLDIPRKIGHSVVHVAVWGANTGVWDWLIASAESGKTGDIDINALHDGHGIAACFDVCRTRWFPGKRELTLETVKFQRMIKIFGASPMV